LKRYLKLVIAIAVGLGVGYLVGEHDPHHSLARIAWTLVGFIVAHYVMMML
jgi:F0F1-type ATP synthase assembly protein I